MSNTVLIVKYHTVYVLGSPWKLYVAVSSGLRNNDEVKKIEEQRGGTERYCSVC